MIIYFLSIFSAFLVASGVFGLLIRFLWRRHATISTGKLVGVAPIHYSAQRFYYIYDIGVQGHEQLIFDARPVKEIAGRMTGDQNEIYVWDRFKNIAAFDTKIKSVIRDFLFISFGLYIAFLLRQISGDLVHFLPLMLIAFLLTFMTLYRKLQDLNMRSPYKVRNITKFKNSLTYRNHVRRYTSYNMLGLIMMIALTLTMMWHDRTKITLYLLGDTHKGLIISQKQAIQHQNMLYFPRLSFTDAEGAQQTLYSSYGYEDRIRNTSVQILHAYLPQFLVKQPIVHRNDAYVSAAVIKGGVVTDFKYLILMLIFVYLWIVRPSKFHL